MRKRSYINYLAYLNTCTVHCTDGSLATVARSFDICLYLAESEIECRLGAILSRSLGSIGSILLGTAKAHLSRR